jgi:tetratricopeptide (TPR) repeat protein
MVDRLGRVSIALLLFWVPLAYYARSADGFFLTKELVALGAGALLVGLALSRILGLLQKPLPLLLVLFLGWMIVDGLLTASDPASVWAGSVHLWIILLTFLAVVTAVGRGVNYEKMSHIAVAAGVFIAAYGISQTLGADGLNWDTHFERRAFSTLGNPDYLAGYLVALLPLSLILTLRASGRRAWIGLRAITFLLFAGLLMTRVRGSLLALALALLVLVLGLLMPWARELVIKNKRTIWITSAVLVAAGVAFWLRFGGWNAFDLGQASVQQRLQTYEVGMEMTKAHPLTGIGLGQLGRDFPLYQWRPYTEAEWPAHPLTLTEHMHNEYLQFAAEGGWIGLGLFLLVLLAFLNQTISFLKNPLNPASSKALLLGILASLVALLGQAVTNFPFQVIPTGVLLGFFLAAPLALEPRPAESFVARPKNRIHLFALGVALLVLGAWGAKNMAASIAMRNTIGETNLKNAVNAQRYANRLAYLAPGDPKAWDAVARARELNNQWDSALEAYNQETTLDPNAVQTYYAMAQDQLMLGHLDEALCTCQKCLSLAPNYSAVLWLEGVCYFKLNRFTDAAVDFEKFTPYAPREESLYVNLGVCYVKSGRKADAVTAWKKAYSLNPNDAQVVQYLKSVGVKI